MTKERDTKMEKTAKNGDRVEKEVANLVSKKLEHHINTKRREEMFDPTGRGIYITSRKMAKYDLAYRVLERTKMEKHALKQKEQNRKNNKQKELGSKKGEIDPSLVKNSRRVVLNMEASRLASYAKDVFEKAPVAELNTIHRYRPHTKVRNETKTGKVQNYSRNVHVALHSHAYTNYYSKEGLDSGNLNMSSRLQKLRTSTDDSVNQDLNSSQAEYSEKHIDIVASENERVQRRYSTSTLGAKENYANIQDSHVSGDEVDGEVDGGNEATQQTTVTLNEEGEDDYYSDHGENTLSDGGSDAEYLYIADDPDLDNELARITMNEGEGAADTDSRYTESRSRSRGSRVSSANVHRRPRAARSHVSFDRQYASSTSLQSEKENRSYFDTPGKIEETMTTNDNKTDEPQQKEEVEKKPTDELKVPTNEEEDAVSYDDDFEDDNDDEQAITGNHDGDGTDDTGVICKSQRDKDKDTVSVETYVSVEHVSAS